MITSTSNPQMKQVSALLKKAKERREKNAFVVEGTKMVQEAPSKSLKAVYISESYQKNSEHQLFLKELRELLKNKENYIETQRQYIKKLKKENKI